MAKEKCDNHCETCPLAGQTFCSLMFAKSTHQSMSSILERLESLEMEMQDLRKPKDVPKVLNPMGYQVGNAEEL